MKRFLLFFLLLASYASQGMAQSEAMYVWRNDGHLTIIEKSEIDSIVHSHYDAENRYNDDWRTMKVYTKDNIYTIPIVVVDRMEVCLYSNMCPDSNHPHVIDLNLPSGTKWACCNVGARRPEEYGAFYAWGETIEKNEYTIGTYTNFNRLTHKWINVGTNITETVYDVAHVRMGGTWRMPTLLQLQELIDNCNHQWTTQNGVKGMLVTGPNDSRLFLPAAGFYRDADCTVTTLCGYYRSSSLYRSYNYGLAYGLHFSSNRWQMNQDFGHVDGCSVRSVCP